MFADGCTILECKEDVRFGMTTLSSSRLIGRDSPERGLEVNDGAMASNRYSFHRLRFEKLPKVVCSSSGALPFDRSNKDKLKELVSFVKIKQYLPPSIRSARNN